MFGRVVAKSQKSGRESAFVVRPAEDACVEERARHRKLSPELRLLFHTGKCPT